MRRPTMPVFREEWGVLIEEINQEHEEVLRLIKMTLDKARHIGDLLLRLKEMVGHGNWGKFLKDFKDKFKFSQDSTQDYMAVAAGWEQIRSAPNFPNLSIREALRYLGKGGK